ncbi:hypothetical protein B0H19DRAFT_1102023 [Mycena capillaripes]|nr:hypothetical protein B0H19DRAFT_1102023 [Mycena capillaripes]
MTIRSYLSCLPPRRVRESRAATTCLYRRRTSRRCSGRCRTLCVPMIRVHGKKRRMIALDSSFQVPKPIRRPVHWADHTSSLDAVQGGRKIWSVRRPCRSNFLWPIAPSMAGLGHSRRNDSYTKIHCSLGEALRGMATVPVRLRWSVRRRLKSLKAGQRSLDSAMCLTKYRVGIEPSAGKLNVGRIFWWNSTQSFQMMGSHSKECSASFVFHPFRSRRWHRRIRSKQCVH